MSAARRTLRKPDGLRGSLLVKGGGRYQIRVGIGNRRQKSLTVTATSQRDLERKWRAFLTDLDGGLSAEFGRVYMRELATTWLRQIERTREYNTFRKYEGIVRLHVVPVLGHLRVDRIGHADIQRCVDAVVDQGKRSTAESLRNVLFAMCKLAVRRRLMTANPVVDIALPTAERRQYLTLSADEARRLLDVCRTGSARLRRVYPIVHLLLHSGLRRGEALGLRWDAVDFEAGTLDVLQQVKRTQGGIAIGPTKTHSRRIVHVGRPAMETLAEHKRQQDALRLELGPAYDDQGFVFTAPDARRRAHGSPIRPTTLWRWMREAFDAAGLALRVHDLRDTSATLALAAGVDLKVISDRLGHSSIVMTADRYIHPREATMRDAADRLADALHGKAARKLHDETERDAI